MSVAKRIPAVPKLSLGGKFTTREAARVSGTGRLRLLDGLRFLAAFAVVLFHFTARDNPAWGREPGLVFPALTDFTRFGYLGVWLFFLISGFVIMMSTDGKPLRAFVLARVTRLFPAYWCAVLLTGGLLYFSRFESPAGAWAGLGPGGLILNLTMMQTAWAVPHVDGAYWSLWVELVFYGLIVGLFLLRGVTRRSMLGLAIAWPVGAQLCFLLGWQPVGNLLGPMFAPFFGLGIVTYLISVGGLRLSYGLVFAADLSIGLFEAHDVIVPWIRGGTPIAAGGGITALVMLGLVGLLLLCTLTPLRNVGGRWLSVLGSLTYPLYLTHEIWGWWMISTLRRFLPDWATLTLSLVFVIGLAALIHYVIEKPVARLLKRWAARDEARLVEERAPLSPAAVPERQIEPVRVAHAGAERDRTAADAPEMLVLR